MHRYVFALNVSMVVCKHKLVMPLVSELFSNVCMSERGGGAGQQWWCNNCWVSTL